MSPDDAELHRRNLVSDQQEWVPGLTWPRLPDVTGMMFPVRCTKCSRVYDLGKVTVIARYTDCSVWKCPGCGITVDDRPVWGDRHYVELDEHGREKQR